MNMYTGEIVQTLKGGPKNWPQEVVAHIQSLLQLGWSDAKQVGLVRNLPLPKSPKDSKMCKQLEQDTYIKVKTLILEGKTNTAIMNHHWIVDQEISEAHIESVRTAVEKEIHLKSKEGALSPPKPKLRIPDLSRSDMSVILSLLKEGKSNAYVCNFHALCTLGLQEYQSTPKPTTTAWTREKGRDNGGSR
ncbi:hypothetical protein GUITHDRAFT_163254 [Guillardia theta CCMP2712]|uniref:Uncharacterized protein n=1 Tax=Guillardia theta (strain CCMP2712) TaxID=905079 RepID=L1J9Z3_GUITC|nr:hypothetical protein GUITHDRAFT_163254 [Guillardia theta CCMP2712]EKX45358.1 hypothetical protein GUITHDRAFT_163254 [Guillardia theta CCMP2712]|eukprot:XP_005832338.1 hypothetical protein GUITHDRAFT_163254 [Guillardia theta CCMP2712]